MMRLMTGLALVLCSALAQALNVFTCEPEWAALVSELAGSEASIGSATTAYQDPHRLEARPSFIAAVRNADLLVCTGADLEVGWLPLLLRRAGNPRIQPGRPGHVLAADFVRKLEVPARIDRSAGDIHPQGNPHVHLNPRNIERIAAALAERLVEIDPANAAIYRARLADFERRWDAASRQWETRGAALRGLRFVSHHRSFSYLADWLDLEIVASLEPKPGIPASSAYLAALLEQLTPAPPVAIIRTPYTDERASQWLSKRLNVPALELPYTVGGSAAASDLFGLFDATLAALEKHVRASPAAQ